MKQDVIVSYSYKDNNKHCKGLLCRYYASPYDFSRTPDKIQLFR